MKKLFKIIGLFLIATTIGYSQNIEHLKQVKLGTDAKVLDSSIDTLLTLGDNGLMKYAPFQSVKDRLNLADLSFGESWMLNYRDRTLDDGATYFPNDGGYDRGIMKTNGALPSFWIKPSAVDSTKIYHPIPYGYGDFARGSEATYVDENGIIQTSGIDEPRIDYSDGDGVLLLEPQSTNLLTYSEDLSNVYWSKNAINLSSDNSSPSNNTAYLMTEDITTSEHRLLRSNIPISNGQNYTFSFYVKPNGRTKLRVSFFGINSYNAIYDFINDTVISSSGGTSATINRTVKNNGWYRVFISDVSDQSSLSVSIMTVNDSNQFNYLGDGVSGFYIWGTQLEQSSTVTSYIPTNGSTATRLQDEATNFGDVNSFNSEEGVLVVNARALADDNTNRFLSISDGTLSNRIMFSFKSNNQISVFISVGGVSKFNQDFNFDIKNYNETIITWGINGSKVYVNSNEEGSSITDSSFPSNILNILDFKRPEGTFSLFGKTKYVKVYKSIAEAQKDYPYIENFIPFLLIGFKRRKTKIRQLTNYKNVA